jgi:hypothetical protein
MNIGNIKKWSFGEMTSNNNGKTSVTSTSGFIIVIVGSLSFLMGVVDKMFIDKSMEIINQAIVFTLIGASLIGYKNYTGHKVSISENAAEKGSNSQETTTTEEIK